MKVNVSRLERHRATIRRSRAVAGVLLLTLLVSACAPESRHRLLTIFFTGVPPLSAEPSTKAPPGATLTPDQVQMLRQQEYQQRLMPTFWAHGPFSAGQCERCHNVAESTSFQGSAAQVRNDPFAQGLGISGARLAAPKEQLCVSCHTSHGREYAATRSLVQHAPAATGECTACHHPHQSRQRYMLLEADKALCVRCHRIGATEKGIEHVASESSSCTGCHNAHIGTDHALLKATDDELSLLYGRQSLASCGRACGD